MKMILAHLRRQNERVKDENECVPFEILWDRKKAATTVIVIKTNGYKHNFYVTFLLIVH